MSLRILFQGDSITDCGRNRAEKGPNKGLGGGFVSLVAAGLLCDDPKMKIYNRGVAGNRILDMYARWEEDCMALDVDVISIHNGINDIGYSLRLQTGASPEKFERMYDMLLTETRQRKPGVSLLLCDPYILNVEFCWEPFGTDVYDNYDVWHREVVERGEIIKGLAKKHGAIFVPFRAAMEEALTKAPSAFWSEDAIHPTLAGSEVLARTWLKAAEPILKAVK